jgi:Zn-finger protein
MAFKPKIAETIAYRSAYICSNPDCNTLTIGPTMSDPALKTKKGEAAHIYGEQPGSARHEASPPVDIQSAENGIWLCANCHTLIDKNNGIDYPVDILISWKKEHEETISILLRTHKSPLPLIAKQSSNRKIAQEVVDFISSKGVYFQDSSCENQAHVTKSTDEVRKKVTRSMRNIDTDKHLKEICKEIIKANQEFMNELSTDNSLFNEYLLILRRKIGRQLKQLRDDVGCDVTGQITSIIPS